MQTHRPCGEESKMFQPPNSNKTISIIVADGGFIINYYVPVNTNDINAPYHYQMKSSVATTIEEVNVLITELCIKIQNED